MWAIFITLRLSSLWTFHILSNSSETMETFWTKVWWNRPFVTPFRNFVQQVCSFSDLADLNKDRNTNFQHLFSYHWDNFNQTWLERSLVGSLYKLWRTGPSTFKYGQICIFQFLENMQFSLIWSKFIWKFVPIDDPWSIRSNSWEIELNIYYDEPFFPGE